MPRPLADQVVVITGASSGIGREVARMFAMRGARVVLAARRAHALAQLAEDIRLDGGKAIAIPTDVADAEAVEHLANRAVETFGRIDTWVNNAAVMLYAPVDAPELPAMRRLMEVNFWGAVHGLRAAIPRMAKTGGGVVICVGSVGSEAALPLQGIYAASKHALRALCESTRMELRRTGVPVQVALIKPASVDTPLYRYARTAGGYRPGAVPPIYDPALPARAILEAAVSPPREQLIGGAAIAAVALHKWAPRLYEAFFARYAPAYEESDEARRAPDNLYLPVDEPAAARLTGRGWKHSWATWTRDHAGAIVAGVAVAGAAAAALNVARPAIGAALSPAWGRLHLRPPHS